MSGRMSEIPTVLRAERSIAIVRGKAEARRVIVPPRMSMSRKEDGRIGGHRTNSYNHEPNAVSCIASVAVLPLPYEYGRTSTREVPYAYGNSTAAEDAHELSSASTCSTRPQAETQPKCR